MGGGRDEMRDSFDSGVHVLCWHPGLTVPRSLWEAEVMIGSKGKKFSIATLFSLASILICAAVCFGEVLFEDDFEENAIDESKWVLQVGWKIVQGQGVKGNALDVNKGESGLSVKNDFTDFEFLCDFKPMGPALYAPQFSLRAQDPENLYMF